MTTCTARAYHHARPQPGLVPDTWAATLLATTPRRKHRHKLGLALRQLLRPNSFGGGRGVDARCIATPLHCFPDQERKSGPSVWHDCSSMKAVIVSRLPAIPASPPQCSGPAAATLHGAAPSSPGRVVQAKQRTHARTHMFAFRPAVPSGRGFAVPPCTKGVGAYSTSPTRPPLQCGCVQGRACPRNRRAVGPECGAKAGC